VPTYARTQRFRRDYERLRPEQRRAFRKAVRAFVADLQAGRPFRPGLRVKRVEGAPGIFEMTWAPDGRATFQYGEPLREGEPHVIWRRVGTHAVFGDP
jgi:hypothetical protein